MVTNKTIVCAVVACAAALLIPYAVCNSMFSFERWRVQEDDIPDFLLYTEQDSDISDEYVTLFAHGYGDTYQQVNRYVLDGDHYGDICDKDIIARPYVTFNFPDAAKTVLPVNAEHSSMGQDNEIEKLHSVVSAIAPQCKGVIGVGCSRGAATWITLFEKHPDTKLVGLIVDSSYEHMEGVVDTIVERAKLAWVPGMQEKAYDAFTSLFSLYKKDGPKPITSVTFVPHDIPVLFVCSDEDGLVKRKNSLGLYLTLHAHRLQRTGTSKTHLFIAPHGKHSKIVSGPSGEAYQNVAHAFYRTYGLPHNPIYAEAGQELFEVCQPDISEETVSVT